MQLHAWAGDRAAALRQYQECVKVMQAELGIEPEPETTALLEAIRSGTAGEPSPDRPFSPTLRSAHNLPPDPTPFIGREHELAQIAERLADPACRLLTIVGPGGMGKTRLAIQAARRQTEVFAHGVFFVDLARSLSADFLAAAMVRTLPITRFRRRRAGSAHRLPARQASAVGAWTISSTWWKAAACSLSCCARAEAQAAGYLAVRLNLREEWIAPLEGLELPGDMEHEGQEHEGAKDREGREAQRGVHEPSRFVDFVSLRDFAIQPAALEHYSATALFLGCIRRLRPDFRPLADDARHIARICRLLDGTPLAIELAAAWHRSLPLSDIARELEHSLSLLATKARDVPERQRSMNSTFDYSWRLLTPHERSILRQASVFRGGFTREAAATITGATLSDLDSLVDASWISLRASGRYEMHELIHQYCAEKLATEHARETGETADEVRDRHAAYYKALLLARQGEFWRRLGAFAEVGADYPICWWPGIGSWRGMTSRRSGR